MKRRSLFWWTMCLGVTIIGGCTPGQQNSAPVATGRAINLVGSPTFTSEKSGFAIWLPVKASEQEQTSDAPNNGPTKSFITQAKTASLTYIVVSNPVPSGMKMDNPAQYIEGVQKGFLEASQAKVEKSEEINLQGTAGRELLLSSYQGRALTRVRIYPTAKFFYQVMAVGPKADVQKQKTQIDKVLDSFRIQSL